MSSRGVIVWGSIEVGMLKALVEKGMIRDFVVGSSVGATNAAFFAFHPNLSGVKKLGRIWRGINSKDVFPSSPKSILLSLFGMRSNLVNPTVLKKIVHLSFPDQELGNSTIPTYLIIADLLTRMEVTFSTGPLHRILLASASIPLVFPPVRIGKHILVDGGVVNNVGISTAVSKGARTIVVLSAGFNCSRRYPPKNLIDTVLTLFAY